MDRLPVRARWIVVLGLAAVMLVACDANSGPTPTTAGQSTDVTATTPPGDTPSLLTGPTPRPTLATSSPTPSPTATPTPSPPSSAPALVGPAPCPGKATTTGKGPAESESSTNWSGYTALSTRALFTCVEATWIQPTIHCSGNSTRAVSIWVGVGGFDQSALEQIGTEADCRHGSAVASMWHESLPTQRAEVPIDITVRPGDTVRARVSAVGKSVYELSIVNVTLNTTFTVRDSNKRLKTTTAEWIVEAPTGGCPSNCHILPMPNFGKLRMSGTWLTASGVRRSLLGSGYTHVNDRMVSTGGQTTRAIITSTASDGSSFVVTWRHS